jgi:hypothetical protein
VKVTFHLGRTSRPNTLDLGEDKRKTYLLSHSRDHARLAASIGTTGDSPTFRSPSSYLSSSTVCRW